MAARDAIEEIRQNQGIYFDPDMVEVLIQSYNLQIKTRCVNCHRANFKKREVMGRVTGLDPFHVQRPDGQLPRVYRGVFSLLRSQFPVWRDRF